MPIAVEHTIQTVQAIVKDVPIGTNLALLHLMWSMLNGSFLNSRGAIFSALKVSGFDDEETARSWAAMRYGVWRLDELLATWNSHVLQQGEWQMHRYEGYKPLAIDLTTFWRLHLHGWNGKQYHGLANRALQGVGLGVVVEVGQIGEQRVPLLRKVVRPHRDDRSQAALQKTLLQWTGRNLAEDEVAVMDAGMHLSQVQEVGIERYVIRMAANCTARFNQLPPPKERGRTAEYGELVRPLARKWKDKQIPATAPQFKTSFRFEGRGIDVHGWHNLVRADVKVNAANETFSILVFYDPLYQHPLVLATNLSLCPRSIFHLYLDRWPVEQVPLSAKQTLGLGRQFVFAEESCLRLPELALFAGNILTYLAAILPPMPTGFWDRRPKRTPGRLRRVLAQAIFPNEYGFHERLRKKRSVTDHLPKGVAAHRRQRQVA